MMKKQKRIFTLVLAVMFILSIVGLAGCSQGAAMKTGGMLYLKVNPEISIAYDDAGMVTEVKGRNDDGTKILETYTEYEGKQCRQVVSELVAAIGEAGYFVEEVEGEKRQITIEIEKGSKLPSEAFLNEIINDVRGYVGSQNWQSPVMVQGASNYGMSNYNDTDYGPDNDGVTDYDDTDYGPNNDGVTDYDDSDYGPNNDGVTDYDDSPYEAPAPAPAPAPVPPANNDSGYSDYDNSDYGDSDYDD